MPFILRLPGVQGCICNILSYVCHSINALCLHFCECKNLALYTEVQRSTFPVPGVQTVHWEAHRALTITLHLDNRAFQLATLHPMFFCTTQPCFPSLIGTNAGTVASTVDGEGHVAEKRAAIGM